MRKPFVNSVSSWRRRRHVHIVFSGYTSECTEHTNELHNYANSHKFTANTNLSQHLRLLEAPPTYIISECGLRKI